MSRELAFLTVDDLLAIHRRMIDEFGGNVELRDRGLLESAAAMPSAQFGGERLHKGIAAMAAAYLFHICSNHAFVDGNKRTALAAAETFLLVNNCELDATNAELEALTLGVAEGKSAKQTVTEFFRKHTRELDADEERDERNPH